MSDERKADQPAAAQPPVTPRQSSPGLSASSDSPNAVSRQHCAGIPDEMDSGNKAASAAAPLPLSAEKIKSAQIGAAWRGNELFVQLCDQALAAIEWKRRVEELDKQLAGELPTSSEKMAIRRFETAERELAVLKDERAEFYEKYRRECDKELRNRLDSELAHARYTNKLEREENDRLMRKLAEWRKPCEDVSTIQYDTGLRLHVDDEDGDMVVPADFARRLAAQLRDANARAERLQRERDEARSFAEKTAEKYNELLADNRILRCAFCNAEYPPGTPPTQHNTLTAHVRVCEKHPMREVEHQLATAKLAVENLGKCEICDRDLLTTHPDGMGHNCVCLVCWNHACEQLHDATARADALELRVTMLRAKLRGAWKITEDAHARADAITVARKENSS